MKESRSRFVIFFRDTAFSVAYLTIVFLIAVNYISRIIAEALEVNREK
jgi:hypothetical protein